MTNEVNSRREPGEKESSDTDDDLNEVLLSDDVDAEEDVGSDDEEEAADANSDAEEAVDANSDAEEAAEACSDAKEEIDEANSDAKEEIDEANSDAKEEIDEANSDAEAAEEVAPQGDISSSDFDSDEEDSDSSSGAEDNDTTTGQAGSASGDVDETMDEDDPVIQAIEAAKEKKKSICPPDLTLSGTPTAICFHPKEDVIVTSTYEGEVAVHSYSDEENVLLASNTMEDESIREVTYTVDGEKLLAAYSNQTLIIYDVRDGLRTERTIKNATDAAVSSLYAIDENTFATGDDDGYVKIWDKRSKESAITFRIGDAGDDRERVTSMISNSEKRILVCTSEEGSITALKIRGGKIQTESEIYDYAFNCQGIFKQESKLAVGDGNGDVYIFNWNEFGKHSDIYTGIGRKEAINALIPITERIIITGGDDGYIRAVNFFPQKFLGVVGKLPYPVDKLDVCNDGHLIASIGSEKCVNFWNVSYFENMAVSTEDKMKKVRGKAKPKKDDIDKTNLPSSSHQNASDFFKGLE